MCRYPTLSASATLGPAVSPCFYIRGIQSQDSRLLDLSGGRLPGSEPDLGNRETVVAEAQVSIVAIAIASVVYEQLTGLLFDRATFWVV